MTSTAELIDRWLLAHVESGECTDSPECACAARCSFCNVTHPPVVHDVRQRACEEEHSDDA